VRTLLLLHKEVEKLAADFRASQHGVRTTILNENRPSAMLRAG
jgi:hypothetical protein